MNYIESADSLIQMALNEDVGNGDVTGDAILIDDKLGIGILSAKQEGVICGLEIFRRVFETASPGDFKWTFLKRDGDKLFPGEKICEVYGSVRAMLTPERTALNFLQRMSGVATITAKFVQKLEGTKVKLLDTRKTIPGFRVLDKYAVKTGGGTNHRFGLFDMVMIKDNHIKAAGGISKAVDLIRKRHSSKYKIEIEVETLEQVKEAVNSHADIIMFDNMSPELLREAVKIAKGKSQTEASGNINLQNIGAISATGVDFISVGAITHSAPALDLSFNIKIMES